MALTSVIFCYILASVSAVLFLAYGGFLDETFSSSARPAPLALTFWHGV